jgi:O-antigen ligase
MTDIQPQSAQSDFADPDSETIMDRIRIGIVCGTILMTTLAYSTQVTSFLYAKHFALACGTALLGLMAIIGPRTSTTRVGAILWRMPFLLSINQLFLAMAARQPMNVVRGDSAFVLLLILVLPCFAGLSFGLLAHEKNRLRIVVSIVAAGVCAALLGVGQYAGILTYLFPAYPASSPIYSVFGNSGLLGGYSAIALSLAFALYLRSSPKNLVLPLALAVLTGALVLSGARTAWIAGIVGCAISIRKTTDARKIAGAIGIISIVTIACLIFAPAATVSKFMLSFRTEDAGANLRWWFWAGTGEMIKAHPILGIALGHYPRESPFYLAQVLWAPGGERYAHNTLLTEHPHNDFLLVWAELGVMGLALCGWLGYRLIRCRGVEWSGLAAWIVFGLFNSPLNSPPHALAGLLLALCLMTRNETPRAPETKFAAWGRRCFGLLALPLPFVVLHDVVLPGYRLERAQRAHIDGRPALALYSDAAISPGALHAEINEKYAIALLDTGDFASARDRFAAALASSDSGSLYLGLGTAEYLLGNNPAAFDALKEAVYRWPSHRDAWTLLIRVCPDDEHTQWMDKAKRFPGVEEIGLLAIEK